MTRDPVQVGERAAKLLRSLHEDNQRLRQRIKEWEAFEVRSLIPDKPRHEGEETWIALMEDLWSDGVVRRTMKSDTVFTITYVPADEVDE